MLRPITTSTARPARATTATWPISLWLTDRVPPPGGSRNPCAQPFTGAARGVSGWPFRVAAQPPAGSASTSVPPAGGACAAATPTGPEDTGTTLPPGSVTMTCAAVSTTRQSWKAEVALTGRRPGTSSSRRARPALTAGAGSST